MSAGPSPAGAPTETSLDVALAAAAAHAPLLGEEDLLAVEAVGRLLSRDVIAQHDHPRRDHSAMDGYAVRSADLPGRLHVVGDSRAGAPLTRALGPGEAVRISTGATLPPGADAVLRVEDAHEANGVAETRSSPAAGCDVRRRGEDLARGDALMAAGSTVTAHSLAAIVASGNGRVTCRRRPRIAVLTTGDELVEYTEQPNGNQVADCNGPGISAQAAAAGGEVVAVQRARDDRLVVERTVQELLSPREGRPPDLLVTVGGISMGTHDHVRGALRTVGVEQILWGVAMRPGRPLWMGRRGVQLVLGLPGNPASAAVCFHLFGRALMGVADDRAQTAPAAAPIERHASRTTLVRCTFDGTSLAPLARQGSQDMTSLATCEALARVPPGNEPLPAGASLRFQALG